MIKFSIWDYVVLILVLIISAAIGVYYRFTGGKQKTTHEYLLADRNMSIIPVGISLMASFMSAITLLGVSKENYEFGTLFVIINISYALATPIAAYLFLPVFFKMDTASVYEYLEKRFGKFVRLYASIAYSLQMILYMGIVLYAPALALEAVTGIDKTLAILIIGLVCTFYSTIGGMKAVLITDVFQSLLMFAAIFSVIICTVVIAGGFGPIWEAAEKGKRIEFLNFDPDPTVRHTWWSLIIGGLFIYLSLYGVNQVQIQRLYTVRNLKAAQKSLWLNVPILSLLSLSTSFSGLCIYYYYKDCDPFRQGRITSRDQVMPLFVVDTMSNIPGLSGLFVSGIFSASLSTISSAVTSLTAVTLEDYVKPMYKIIRKRQLLDINTTFPSKIMAFIYGILCVALAFVAQSMGGVLQASLTIFGVVGGPLLALFSLGMFTSRANEKGAIMGLTLGFLFAFWIGFGGPKPLPKSLDFSTEGCNKTIVEDNRISPLAMKSEDTQYFWLYKISYMWYSTLGFIITFVFGYIFSYICEKFNFDSNEKIYADNTKTHLKYELFVPPVADYLKKQRLKNTIFISEEDKSNIMIQL